MTWPVEYGGGGQSNLARIIMGEAMISAGAPIAASWFADRQMGPALFTYGTEDQQAEFLPGMLSGETTWCIGMSEPDAGSDLAGLKTSAVRDGDVFVVKPEDLDLLRRRRRLLLPDLSHIERRATAQGRVGADRADGSPGIEVRPITDMTTNRHFCEVYFDDVRVPAENLVGVEGNAFKQTMAQLEHERGGIDRLVSTSRCTTAVAAADTSDPRIRQEIARLETGYRLGRVLVYREALKQAPAGFSAATKCFCTEHQQHVADFAASVLGMEAVADDYFNRAIAYGPAYTIMGGTSDIMRNILGERVLGLPREPRP